MKKHNVGFTVAACLAIVVALTIFLNRPEPGTQAPPSDAQSDRADALTADSLTLDTHTGLVVDTNLRLILANCSTCHSTDLVRQNRFTRDGWLAKIRWMQQKHNLWDLGDLEDDILDYLEKYYSPSSMDKRARLRREPLTDIQWYDY